MRRVSLILVVLVSLAACSQVSTPRPVPPETVSKAPIAAKPGVPSKVARLLRVQENMPAGYKGGHLASGSSCTAVAEFEGDGFAIGQAPQAQSQFAREYLKRMEAAGYRAQALALQVFDTADVDLVVEALLDKVIINACNKGPGEAYVLVSWEIKDARSTALVYQGQSEGLMRADYVEGMEVFGLVVQSFGEATNALLAEPEVAGLLSPERQIQQ